MRLFSAEIHSQIIEFILAVFTVVQKVTAVDSIVSSWRLENHSMWRAPLSSPLPPAPQVVVGSTTVGRRLRPLPPPLFWREEDGEPASGPFLSAGQRGLTH